jgi:hypothetical protein
VLKNASTQVVQYVSQPKESVYMSSQSRRSGDNKISLEGDFELSIKKADIDYKDLYFELFSAVKERAPDIYAHLDCIRAIEAMEWADDLNNRYQVDQVTQTQVPLKFST